MKRSLVLIIGMGGIVILALMAASLFPRPPLAAAVLIRPILDDAIRADDADYSPGSHGRRVEEGLDGLARNTSAAGDIASVILLDYSLGAHNGETQICAVSSRGKRIMPLLEQYRKHPAGLLKPWYWPLRLNKKERAGMYEQAVGAIQRNEIVGCE